MSKVEIQALPIYADLPMVAALTTLSVASVQKLVRENAFPRPRQISGRRVGWLIREVQEWAETRPQSDLPPPTNAGRRRQIQSPDCE